MTGILNEEIMWESAAPLPAGEGLRASISAGVMIH